MILTPNVIITKGSHQIVEIKCDLNISNKCRNIFTRVLKDHLKSKKHEKGDACINCSAKTAIRPPAKYTKSESNKRTYRKHLESRKQKNRDYYKRNKQARIKKQLERHKIRYTTDHVYRLKLTLRARLRALLKANKIQKNRKSIEYLGCSIAQLKIHLENQFKSGMTWENRKDWHIDHIIPLSTAVVEQDLYKLCHYTNLRPLWAQENLKKGDKIEQVPK